MWWWRAAHLVHRALLCSWAGRGSCRSWLRPDKWLHSDRGSTGTRPHLQRQRTVMTVRLRLSAQGLKVRAGSKRQVCVWVSTCFTELPCISRCTHTDALCSPSVAGASILTLAGWAGQILITDKLSLMTSFSFCASSSQSPVHLRTIIQHKDSHRVTPVVFSHWFGLMFT